MKKCFQGLIYLLIGHAPQLTPDLRKHINLQEVYTSLSLEVNSDTRPVCRLVAAVQTL